jgi:hypothetical protein
MPFNFSQKSERFLIRCIKLALLTLRKLDRGIKKGDKLPYGGKSTLCR